MFAAMLEAGSAKLVVINDSEDPWGMEVNSFNDVAGEFKLLSPKKTAEFLGYPEKEVKPFKIIEDGDVRTVLEGIYGYNKSFAIVKFYVPKKGKNIKTHVTLHMAEASKMIKLSFNTIKGEFVGQTAFGTDNLVQEGKAAVFQKFSGVKNDNEAFVIVNDGTYSGDYEEGILNQVLLRTAGYSAHPIPKYLPEGNQIKGDEDTGRRLIMPDDRYMDHIDMGIREFSFEFYGDKDIRLADYNAALFNEKPFALSFFPSGNGKKCGNFIKIDNKVVTMSAFKKAYDEKGFIVRLYNSSDKEEKAEIFITPINLKKEINFGKYEVKTFRIDTESGKFVETDIMER